MSTETKHTPLMLPLRVARTSRSYALVDVLEANGAIVCCVADEATAHEIVRACNAHYDLVRACEMMLPTFSRGSEGSEDNIATAQAALAKAKGRKPIRLEGRFIGSDPMMNND